MEFFFLIWNEAIIRPMLNTLMVLYVVCFNNMGLAIIAFTILVRLVTMPLTLKQIRQMRRMSELQPRMREIQERYSGDRARVSQETMKLYRESGVSPIGCLGPLVVQLPILIGLFRVLIQTLFTKPEDLVDLSQKLYPWITFVPIHSAAPLSDTFLWLKLGEPDPSPVVLPILVAATTFVQQKMTMTPSPDPRQQSSQNMMLWMIPIFLGFFSLQWPSGLPLYWIVSNVIGVGIQYFITGWGPLFPLIPRSAPAASRPAQSAVNDTASEENENDGVRRTNRQNRRRGRRTGAEGASADHSEVEVEVLSRGKAGFLGIGAEVARVRVTRTGPGEARPAAAPVESAEEPAEPDEISAPAPDVQAAAGSAGEGTVAGLALVALNNILSTSGVNVTCVIRTADDPDVGGPIIDISGDDSGLLIGRRGQSLQSLQFIVNLIVRKEFGEGVRVALDVERYRQRREASLKDMANKVAERVSQTGRGITLEPMSAADRRIVHLTLADREDVATESVGFGEERKVSIFPKR